MDVHVPDVYRSPLTTRSNTLSPSPTRSLTSDPSFRVRYLSARRRDMSTADQETIIRDILLDLQKTIQPADDNWPHDVQMLTRFIHNHLFEDWLNVTEAKAHCGFRNNNISSRFKYIVGIGIRRYIESLRMETAGRLLTHETKFPVFLVALALGYASAESFNKAFRRYFDCTPTDYRKWIRRLQRQAETNEQQTVLETI